MSSMVVITESSRPKVLDDDERHARIMAEIDKREKHRKPDDSRDLSRHPSYSKMSLPYEQVCRNRYIASAKAYDAQFQKEIKNMQTQCYTHDEISITRHLSYTSLWPPLHTRKERDFSRRKIFSLSRAQRDRFNYLMSHDVI